MCLSGKRDGVGGTPGVFRGTIGRIHGGAQLRPAVTAQGGQDVAGQAGGVDSGQDVLTIRDAAAHQCEVLGAVDPAAQGVGGELPVRGGQVS